MLLQVVLHDGDYEDEELVTVTLDEEDGRPPVLLLNFDHAPEVRIRVQEDAKLVLEYPIHVACAEPPNYRKVVLASLHDL